MPTVSEVLKLAVEHHRAHRLAQAMEVYHQILEQEPQHPEALYGLGVLAQQTGQYQMAEKFLKTLLGVQPESVKGWFSLGNLRQVQGQLSEAVEAYQQALAIEPDSVTVHNNLGYTLQLQGKWEEAVTCYQKALKLQPDCPEAEVNLANALYAQGKLSLEKQAHYARLNYHLGVARQKAGDFKTAVVYYRQAIALKPDAAVYNNLGIIFQQQGQLSEAVESYQQALHLKPELAQAHYNLGNTLQQQGQLEAAVKSYQQALRLEPNAAVYNNLGIILQQKGQLDEAVESYQQAVSLKPDWAQPHYNLGIILQQKGQLDEAVESYHQALRLKPDWAQPHYNLGIILQQKGQLDEAVESYHQAVSLKPEWAQPYSNLGIILQQQGQLDEAVESYQQALRLKPDAAVYNNLGNALGAQGQLGAAVESYQQALRLKPDLAEAYLNLGNALQQQGQLKAAVESYQQTLRLKPDAIVYNNLGNALKEEGQLKAAVESYQQALCLKPDFPEAYLNLGNALGAQGKLEAAIESYQQALRLKPDFPEAYLNLGNALKEEGHLKAAIESYQQVLRLKPDLAEAYLNLGNALKEEGQLEPAIECYQQALRLEPDLPHAKFNICMSQLPIIYSSCEEIQLRRNQYQQHLQKLAQSYQLASQKERAKAAEAVGSSQPFFLAYQGLNDRDLQQAYGEMICQLMSSCYPQWSQPIPIPSLGANEKIRVGFVSGFFRYHSNWKIPIKGWVENLDKNKFELFGYHTDSIQDPFTARATQAFVKFIQGPLTVEKWCEAIAQDKLHILIFPEIGMEPITVKLACLKLAPIQMTSWGHPDTSGLPTIDYYLSSELMELENAQEHYSEKLVRLPNLSIHYSPVEIQAKAISKTEIGIKNEEIMFWCCQSLFKYLPQHDDVFPRIAREIAKCKFVFISYHQSEKVTEVFRQRLSRAFEEFELNYQDHCIFLPPLDRSTFAGTAAMADVFLDSIAWSGCNSSLEAINYDIPIVTWPGDLMRGRHTLAILKMMGVEETIASSKDEYVKIAVRLGQDSQYRQYISGQVAENKDKLYGDLQPIRALEEFLGNAVRSSLDLAIAVSESIGTINLNS